VESIGPGVESVGVQLWAAAPGAARWGRSTWGGAAWAGSAWRQVGCDVAELTHRWGAAQESGILSVAQAGELDLGTMDPGRELDPINTASPYYGAVRPGTPVRVVGYSPAERILATCFIDEASHDLASSRGRIRAVDGIAYLAQAQLPAMALPNTLRARVRAIVNAVGLAGVVPVEPEAINGEWIPNGGFESVDNAAADYAQPVGWAFYPDGSNCSAHRIPSFAHDGERLLEIYNADTTGRIGYRLLTGLQPGGVYAVNAWGHHAGRVASLVLKDPDNNFEIIYQRDTLVADPAVPTQFASGTFTATGTRAQIELGYLGTAPVAGTYSRFDSVSIVGPTTPPLETDPPVAPHDATQTVGAWAAITAAALDALTYVWVDPTGMLRFRSWGGFSEAPISIGCKPADADPADQWLVGLSTIEPTVSGDAVRNSVRAYSSGTTWQPAATDAASIATYGPRPFDVDRVVPDFAVWAGRILADRADAGLELAVGQVRPYTVAELDALLATQLAGPAVIRVRDDAHGELVDLDVGMIGAQVGMTPAGWRWALVTLLSRVEWDAIAPEPPEPPTPPAGTWHTETRSYIATSDALLALTSGGSKYGAGASSSLPVGVWSGWTYRGLIRFPAIPWTKVRAVTSATLKLQTTDQVRVGFGSSPKVEIRRITSDWSAGSASSPSSGNAVVWPGPSTTGSGAVTSSLPTGENAAKSIRVDAIARAWAPASIGGSGALQYGIRLGEASSSSSNTGEVWPVEKGGAARPTLELVLEVFD
jgi:hypothetical protein